MPTWKIWEIHKSDGERITIQAYRCDRSDDGKTIAFRVPAGNFIIREDCGGIDAGGYWKIVAEFALENITGYMLISEKAIA